METWDRGIDGNGATLVQREPHRDSMPGVFWLRVCGESRKIPGAGHGPAAGPALDFPGSAAAGGGGGGMLPP